MRVKYLEISGFKSFAKKALLEFSSPVSAIVGPNGSGKSNVAEAIRFVLGEQSLKSLRGKRGEDLIFNGTKNLPRQNRAKVSVSFDNADRVFPVDYDEVVISREVHRDSSNQYFINGTQVRLKDIFELLSSVHIGASGHHIISQGEADRILSASLKERKTMIEDALGLKIYHFKIDESKKRLEKTEENITRVESLGNELTPRIRFLKSQMKKIEEMRAVRGELTSLYAEYLKKEHVYLEGEQRTIAEEKASLSTVRAVLAEDIARLESAVSARPEDARLTHTASLEETLRRIREEKNTMLRHMGRLEGVLDYARAQVQKAVAPATPEGGVVHADIPYGIAERFFTDASAYIDQALASDDLGRIKEILTAVKESLRRLVAPEPPAHLGEISSLASVSAHQERQEKEIADLVAQKEALDGEIKAKTAQESAVTEELSLARAEIEKTRDAGRESERALFELRGKERDVSAKLTLLATREEQRVLEEGLFKEELGEGGALIGRAIFDYEQYEIPADAPREERTLQQERRRKIEKIKIRLEDSGASSEHDIEKEFSEVMERQNFLTRELEDLRGSKASLLSLIADLEEKLAGEFKDGIRKINDRFGEFFALMFGGGKADIFLVKEEKRTRGGGEAGDEDIPVLPEDIEYTEGIDLNVELPRKKIKGLNMLSGGERALVSIALLFALSQVNPPPFLVLDETDAALDEANSRKYGDMLESLSKFSELIVITHNRETMSRAGVLYGVTMDADSASKIFSIKLDEAKEYAK